MLWRELGGLGRIALVGVVASVVVAVALGFLIQGAAQRHLLDTRTAMLTGVVDNLGERELLPLDRDDAASYGLFDRAVRLKLLGGETVRVKLWDAEGTIVYSDVDDLVGQRFALGPNARAALAGEPGVSVVEPTKPEHVHEADLGELLEFYLPVRDADGRIVGLFEVYQQAEPLRAAVAGIRRNVWLSIGSGLGVVGLFMGSLTVANARVLNRRRRQAEELFQGLLQAEDAERHRIVGALHDDVGQPLYRLLYGLQGCGARVDDDSAVAAELDGLAALVREVDGTLRAELTTLHRGVADEVGLTPALEELVAATRAESGLTVDFDVDLAADPSPLARQALLRAAQEALANVRKHAEATCVAIRVHDNTDAVVLEVHDDGRGTTAPAGLGLAITRERLAAVGGQLSVRSRGGGTRLRAAVPRTDNGQTP
jgi:two-component system, NarL family, sensor kinase